MLSWWLYTVCGIMSRYRYRKKTPLDHLEEQIHTWITMMALWVLLGLAGFILAIIGSSRNISVLSQLLTLGLYLIVLLLLGIQIRALVIKATPLREIEQQKKGDS
jgi:hypothetical protein